jgi:hypothetical protein
MADTKISALTAATTPLAGTEVLPIVQSGVTKQVSVADSTAGRAVSAASLTLTTTPLAATSGGTGQSSYAIGDLLYASTTTALSKLADVATGSALISGGVGVAPSWGKIGLTTHVSGTLPIANGGTNSTATPTNGGVIYGTGTAYAVTAAGTSGQLLQSAGAAAPTWTSAINDVSIGQTTRAAGNFTAVLAGTATNTFSGTLVSSGDFEQGAKRWGYRGANGTSAGTTGTYTITMSGFPGQGSGGTNEAITNYWVTVHSTTSGHFVQGVALYTNNYNGDAVLLATVGTNNIGGSITFGVSGSSPTATITNSSGGTPAYYWFTIGM